MARAIEETRMKSFLESVWYGAADAPGKTWEWFNGLNREEWLVVLTVVCACGFISLLGFRGNRL
jgi:hypothetical protein